MKFGIREAVEVVFKTTRAYSGEANDYLLSEGYAWKKGEPVMYFDTLKTSTTEGTATTVYAMGGKGNPRLIAWEGEKVITFTFEDALISSEGMAILTGAGLVDAAVDTPIQVHRKAVVEGTVVANVITVDLTAEMGANDTLLETDIFGFVLDADGEIIAKLGASTTAADTTDVVTFAYTTALTDLTVLVDYYVITTSGVKEITIEPDKFAGYFYIEGETLFRRQVDGQDLPAMIVIPNAKIQTAFTFAMSPSGDPSTFTFTADAFPGVIKGDTTAKKVLYGIQLFEA